MNEVLRTLGTLVVVVVLFIDLAITINFGAEVIRGWLWTP